MLELEAGLKSDIFWGVTLCGSCKEAGLFATNQLSALGIFLASVYTINYQRMNILLPLLGQFFKNLLFIFKITCHF
jgi:hypothetical protein